MLEIINELTYTKDLKQCLAHCNCYIRIIIAIHIIITLLFITLLKVPIQ